MNWRPDNWEKLRKEIRERLEYLVGASANSADHKNILIDAGADAMLEALKAKGVRIEADDWPSMIYDETYDFYKSKVPSKKGKGWLVFMPEDETKGG